MNILASTSSLIEGLIIICLGGFTWGIYEYTRRRLGLSADLLEARQEILDIARAERALRPPGWERPVRTLTGQLLWLILTVSVMVLGLISGAISLHDVRSGVAQWSGRFSTHVIYVHRSIHPEAFWTIVGLFFISGLGFLALTCAQLVEIAQEDGRRGSAFWEKCVLWASGLVFAGSVGYTVWFLAS
jgi:hypothetical protein